jgi:hypothetical protein
MNLLADKILGHSALAPLLKDALWAFTDWQWREYLSVQVPTSFMQEISGFGAGAALAGSSDGAAVLGRATTLANFPGSITDLVYVLADEFGITYDPIAREEGNPLQAAAASDALRAVAAAIAAHPVGARMSLALRSAKSVSQSHAESPLHWLLSLEWPLMQCSMMGMWGSRTTTGRIFSGRNLDWLSNSGINRAKYVVVWRPPGGIAHATVGFAGLQGALTGMSAAGLTVHEANLEEKQESFRGFPWMLRLRWIMAQARNLTAAKSMWAASNNTVGFNHAVASAVDRNMYVMETEARYTAYFEANDPREAAAMYNTSAGLVQAGFPLTEALWRTNHGYDPKIRQDFLWSQGPKTDSQYRYDIIHDQIAAYASAGTPIGPLQAINVTSLPGDKGDDFYHCGATHKGSNVLSVTFDPEVGAMFAAWEAFEGALWRPAACNTYVQIDMKAWFEGRGPLSAGVPLVLN